LLSSQKAVSWFFSLNSFIMSTSTKFIILFLFASLSNITPGIGQVNWNYNYEKAISIAKVSGKLVFIDFYADWCGPCRKMDIDVWNTSEMTKESAGLVMVKVDVDRYPEVASAYNISSIPRMILIDPFENRIDEITGYQNTGTMQRFLGSYPNEIYHIVAALKALEKKGQTTPTNLLSAGNAFVYYLPSLQGKAKSKFGVRANYYYSKAASKAKKTKNDVLINDILLAQGRLSMLQSNYKKALKKVEGINHEKASMNQLKLKDELCISCLYNGNEKEEARKYYSDYASSYDTPKTLDELIKTIKD
jgi:thiol-disulfide isomerase/thioredoxin